MKKTVIALVLYPLITIAAPKIEVKETHWDYGYAPQNTALSHSYWIKNAGDDTLNIIDVKPGCGCTKAPIQKNKLAGGDSTIVELIFNTRAVSGKVTKNARITSSDSSRANVTIDFSASIFTNPDTLSPVRATPDQLVFGEDSKKLSVEIQNYGKIPAKLNLAERAPDEFKLKYKKDLLKPGDKRKIEIEWKGILLEHDINRSFTFEIGGMGVSRLSIPYTLKGEKGPEPGKTQQHTTVKQNVKSDELQAKGTGSQTTPLTSPTKGKGDVSNTGAPAPTSALPPK